MVNYAHPLLCAVVHRASGLRRVGRLRPLLPFKTPSLEHATKVRLSNEVAFDTV